MRSLSLLPLSSLSPFLPRCVPSRTTMSPRATATRSYDWTKTVSSSHPASRQYTTTRTATLQSKSVKTRQHPVGLSREQWTILQCHESKVSVVHVWEVKCNHIFRLETFCCSYERLLKFYIQHQLIKLHLHGKFMSLYPLITLNISFKHSENPFTHTKPTRYRRYIAIFSLTSLSLHQ